MNYVKYVFNLLLQLCEGKKEEKYQAKVFFHFNLTNNLRREGEDCLEWCTIC